MAPSLRTRLDCYLAHLEARGCSPSTLTAARKNLPRFFRYLKGERVKDLRAVTEAEVAGYLRELAKKPLKAWTRQSYLVSVRGFFAFLYAQGEILRDPAREVRLPRFTTLPRVVLSIGQAGRLMTAPSPGTAFGLRDRALLETLYGTGIRLSECVRLDLLDLDMRGRSALVREGKGKKDRVVPLGERAALALEGYLRQARPALIADGREGALFVSRYGTRLAPITIQVLVREYGQGLGLPLSPHSLRHACATHLLRGGAGVRQVQALLGHRSIETTVRYTRVELADLRQVLARAHPRERDRIRETS